MSCPYSAESAESTSDLNEPECESSPNAKPTRQPDESSSATGPESHATPTLPISTPSGWQAWGWSDEMMDTPRLNEIGTIRIGTTVGAPTASIVSISCAEVSHAKTSQSQENEPALPENEADCSMKQHESQTLFSDQEDGCSLRTYPDYFPPMEDATSPSYSRRWPTSGFTTSPGECWTADTSECPNGGGAYSSLPDVLEATVPSRFYLSQKAAAGILRRAEKRGRALPPALDNALRTLSTSSAEDRTTTQRKPTTSYPEAA